MAHLGDTVLMAALVAGASALWGDRAARERVYLGVRVFASSLAAVVAGSWVMYWIHG